MLPEFTDAISGENEHKIKGTVVLMKKNVLAYNDFYASVRDRLDELVGKHVSVQLISSVNADPGNKLQGKRGKPAYLEEWITTVAPLTAGECAFNVTFDSDEEFGVPGAFVIRNNHHNEFYLKSVTLEDVPNHGRVHFDCNSWVYPADKYTYDRVFFANRSYLPNETPLALVALRKAELKNLRGNGTEEELKEWDRIYDYALYNDLGDPDKGSEYVRPVLGGSSEYPYPRRGKTGRKPSKTDPETESKLPLLMTLNPYVPRDEVFDHLKMSDFLGYGLKSIVHVLWPELEGLRDGTPDEFDTFQDILKIYDEGIHSPDEVSSHNIKENFHFELLKELVHTNGEHILKYPMPQVIREEKLAWRGDEEFGRETLAGVNPVIIRRLQEFPPRSNLAPQLYGNQTSSMTKKHIEKNLDGLTVDEAIRNNKLFILDHHDTAFQYLRRINATSTKTYATRTLLFLKDDCSLLPIAIELSLPHPDGDEFGPIGKVYTPSTEGIEGSLWQLAKAYASVNDSGVHQLVSHWLNTHCVIEPFVIATHRQLSVLHPIHKLLHPHFRDTMNINAVGRQVLANAGGLIELTVFPGKYAMEMSSAVYKDWVFPDQALPAALIKRGMAVEDENSPHGLRLFIEDYPYAVDGLEIWSAIKTWVEDYCYFYYRSDEAVRDDSELQCWWEEVQNKGHADKKKEPWWPKLQSMDELIQTCTIIIWTASALHAAVNFGQYAYAGYMPVRPTISRRLIPEPGSADYLELESNPDKAYLKTVTGQLLNFVGISLIELLSTHSSDEIYLGQRESHEWTSEKGPLRAFERFGKKLEEIGDRMMERNGDQEKWKNRVGPVKVPYTLLYPSSEHGLTGRGIPNSVSI